jgi:hypothetical protein
MNPTGRGAPVGGCRRCKRLPSSGTDNTLNSWVIEEWRKRWKGSADAPRAVLGLVGDIRDRVVVSAIEIDSKWANGEDHPGDQAGTIRPASTVHCLEKDLNFNQWRFRKVSAVRFGRLHDESAIWVGADGNWKEGGSRQWCPLD